MELNSKNDRRHNAIKHGPFAKELVILGENKDDFDELHQSCVKELKPSGRMEEEVVLAIAKYMWRKPQATSSPVPRSFKVGPSAGWPQPA